MTAAYALAESGVNQLPGNSAADGRLRVSCSQAQQRFWFEEQLHPGNPGLNVAVRWKLEGDVLQAELEEAWRLIIERHQTLRTSLEVLDGEPVQIVEPSVAFTIPLVDLSLLSEEEATAQADELATKEARTPFDLSLAPLIRVTRLVMSTRVSILLVTAHHAVCDGWSVGILAHEMGEICGALRAGQKPDLPALQVDYGTYAAWEREWLAESSLASETEFSRRLLQGYKQFELLPDRPRPAIQTSQGGIATVLLPRTLTGDLDQLSRDRGCTLFMLALAALTVLLHRYSGEEDIAVGTQVAGRDEAELEALVGCFINTIALRTDVSGDPTFLELLERVRDVVTETFELRHFPLERLIEVVNPKRDLSRNALFSLNFIFQRSFIKNENFGPFKLIDLPSRSAGALYDLNFFMVERPEGWRVSCEYNTDLFDLETVAAMLERLQNVFRAVLADPAQRVSAIPLLSETDRYELIVERNRTEKAYPSERTLPELFKDQVRRAPDARAIVCGDETLSYAALSRAAADVAQALRHAGHAPAARVGIFLERSADLVVALLGVLESGSAYVPLDPAYPRERLATILEDASLAAVITHSNLRSRLPAGDVPVVTIDALPAAAEPNVSETSPRPEDTAYVIYTSGSTGKPKGVAVPHRALVNFLYAMRELPGLEPSDTLVAVTTVSFDIAGLELYLPLIVGAKLVVASEAEVVDGAALLDTLRRNRATVMQATPVSWQLLIEAGWQGDPALKMICGGEALPRRLADQLLQRGDQLWNMYGPTETTIWSSVERVVAGLGPVELGPPIANTQFYVLDARGQLAVPGTPGELFIGGDGVALGYLGLPELTAERFVHDTFRNVPDARLYRTGDLVRTRANGRLEFLGRTDHQIKLRGFRIELGEIEAVLLRQPEVAEAVVIAGEDVTGSPAILAYVVCRGGLLESKEATNDELRRRLGLTLPSYMIPALVIALPVLPRTPNGKVDRRSLPAPERISSSSAGDSIVLTPTEARLTELIGELLGRERLAPTDDIFALGFHSLLAVRLVARISERLGVAVPLRWLFSYPTVRGIAQQIDSMNPAKPVATAAEPVTSYNTEGTLTPFIYLHSDLLAEGLYCRKIAASVGADRPFHAVAPHGSAALPQLPTIEAMANDYLPLIRSVQPHGPYRLGGFCVSGLVAYELARLLRAFGETVEDVLLINASALPKRSVAPFDALVRRIGLDARLEPRLREKLIYNIARLHGAVASGPSATADFLARRLHLLGGRAGGQRPFMRAAPPEAYAFRGTPQTETHFAHIVAALTYHPHPYDGDITLIWSAEQLTTPVNPTLGWSVSARNVRVVSMGGGHATVLHEDLDELSAVIAEILSE